MTSGFQSAGVDFDLLFDPYVQGTKPANTGYTITSYGDLANRYAPLVYGTKRANVGYGAPGVSDVTNLWAAYGTATYSLPFNGQTYTAAYNIPNASSGYALIGFEIVGGNTWQIYQILNGAAAVTLASGAVPSSAATVQYTWGSYVVGVGQTDAGGSVSNGAVAATALTLNPVAYYQTATATSTSGSRDRQYTFTVDFFSSGGGNVSHNVCTLVGDTEGSV